jgi:hypothetical protein
MRGEMYLKFETGRGGEEKATASPLLERGDASSLWWFGKESVAGDCGEMVRLWIEIAPGKISAVPSKLG